MPFLGLAVGYSSKGKPLSALFIVDPDRPKQRVRTHFRGFGDNGKPCPKTTSEAQDKFMNENEADEWASGFRQKKFLNIGSRDMGKIKDVFINSKKQRVPTEADEYIKSLAYSLDQEKVGKDRKDSEHISNYVETYLDAMRKKAGGAPSKSKSLEVPGSCSRPILSPLLLPASPRPCPPSPGPGWGSENTSFYMDDKGRTYRLQRCRSRPRSSDECCVM